MCWARLYVPQVSLSLRNDRLTHQLVYLLPMCRELIRAVYLEPSIISRISRLL